MSNTAGSKEQKKLIFPSSNLGPIITRNKLSEQSKLFRPEGDKNWTYVTNRGGVLFLLFFYLQMLLELDRKQGGLRHFCVVSFQLRHTGTNWKLARNWRADFSHNFLEDFSRFSHDKQPLLASWQIKMRHPTNMADASFFMNETSSTLAGLRFAICQTSFCLKMPCFDYNVHIREVS